MLTTHRLITIKEARKLLGKKSRELTDAEVREVIDQLDYLAILAYKKLTKQEFG